MSESAAPTRYKCCACCATGTPGECGFNGRGTRDDHASPCHKCEPEAYEQWAGSVNPREDADVPF